ncbi:hypothetical protein JCM6882_000242 [Rhodosporidiobolus microsporus]
MTATVYTVEDMPPPLFRPPDAPSWPEESDWKKLDNGDYHQCIDGWTVYKNLGRARTGIAYSNPGYYWSKTKPKKGDPSMRIFVQYMDCVISPSKPKRIFRVKPNGNWQNWILAKGWKRVQGFEDRWVTEDTQGDEYDVPVEATDADDGIIDFT